MSKAVSSPTQAESTARVEAHTDPFLEILAASGSRSSAHAFFTDCLKIISTALASPYASLYVSRASDVIETDWHTGPTDPAFWKRSVQDFLTESLERSSARAKLYNAKTGSIKAALLSAPVFDGSGRAIGAVALVVTPVQREELAERLAMLESLTSLASCTAEVLGGRPAGKADAAQAQLDASLAGTAEIESPEQLAFALTNNLRNQLGCEQVSLGLARRRRIKILSISGLDHVATATPGIAPLHAAMEECLDLGTPIVCQQQGVQFEEGLSGRHRLHAQWRSAANGDSVASIPLKVGERTVGVLSLRQNEEQPFDRQQIDEIAMRVQPFVPVLLMSRRASRGIFRHLTESVLEGVSVLTGRGRWRAKIATAAVAGVLAWAVFGTMSYDVSVPCTVAPAEVRHVSVPFDGVLEQAHVLPGDAIGKGQILCSLKHDELEDQRSELMAELKVLEHEANQAMAENVPANVQLALARKRLIATQLTILENRIERANVRAPIDGVVASGDLRKRLGSVVTKGDPLFEIAPVDELMLELRVPERDVDDLSQGLEGRFASTARPEECSTFTVERVRPTAEICKNQNVFVAEARGDLSCDQLRPGMEGVASVHVGRRPVWWVLFHRAIEYVRLKLWL